MTNKAPAEHIFQQRSSPSFPEDQKRGACSAGEIQLGNDPFGQGRWNWFPSAQSEVFGWPPSRLPEELVSQRAEGQENSQHLDTFSESLLTKLRLAFQLWCIPGCGSGFVLALETSKLQKYAQNQGKAAFIFCTNPWYAPNPGSKET